MDIEKLATSAVVESISMTDVLSPFINEGDREPSWDGNIYIFENKRKKKNGIKKVPVQVKGECRKRVPLKEIPKYTVKYSDLNNWLNDGGILLFVVYIDEIANNRVIYYSALLPVRIRQLKKISRGKKSLRVPLKVFPTDNNRKVSVLLDFYEHMQMQTSFANAPLCTIEDLEKEGVLENVSITVTTYARPNDNIDVESLLLQNDVYLYAKIKGSPIPQPLPDVPTDIHLGKTVQGDILVKEHLYYTEYRVERYKDRFEVFIGKSLTVTMLPEEKKLSLDFKNKGTLSDFIYDTKFIVAVLENKEITIDTVRFPLDDLERNEVKRFKSNLEYYNDVKKMLEILGVNKELECDNLSEKDQNNIRNFTNALVYGNGIGFPEFKNDVMFGRFNLGNLVLLIWADREKKMGNHSN